MLVLSRKISEKIHIGDGIVVEVRRIAGNRVTLAIEAPREMRILRGELYEAAKEFEADPAAVGETAAAPAGGNCIVSQFGLANVENVAQSMA